MDIVINRDKSLGRNEIFDLAKGVGIYLVVVGHLLNEGGNLLFQIISLFHMPLFFFISGWFLWQEINKYTVGVLVMKKVRTILIPFFFWSLVSLFANTLFDYLNGNLRPELFMKSSFEILVQARSVWFLIQLFLTFLLFVVCYKINIKLFNKVHYLIFFAVWLLMCLALPNQLLSCYKLKWLFPYYIVGFFARTIKEKKGEMQSKYVKKIKSFILLFYPIVSIIIILKLHEMQPFFEFTIYGKLDQRVGIHYDLSIISFLLGMLGIAFIFELSILFKGKIRRAISNIGRYSIDIYVIHMFLIKIIMLLSRVIQKNVILYNYVLVPIYACLITFVVWQFSKQILHRIKAYRWMMGLKE